MELYFKILETLTLEVYLKNIMLIILIYLQSLTCYKETKQKENIKKKKKKKKRIEKRESVDYIFIYDSYNNVGYMEPYFCKPYQHISLRKYLGFAFSFNHLTYFPTTVGVWL